MFTGRLDEGHGEAIIDIGLEDNGDPMGFSKEDWDFAYSRTLQCATTLHAECRLLMTKNVGGDVDVDTSNQKDKSCSGKVMIRRHPESVDDVIETRISVVGNGTME